MLESQINHIFECCKNGKSQLLLEALEINSDPRIVDDRHNSVLAIALKNGDWQTAETLIDNDYTYFHPNKPGLISACQCKKDEAEGIQLVLKLGADIDSQDLQHRTALMTVSLLGHVNKAQELIENKANVSQQDIHGNTALMDAVQSKSKNTVELILKQNPEIDQVNNQGETALIIELKQKSPLDGIVTQLLEAGSNPEIVDNNKKSAWLIAKQKHPKIARLIETHLNKVNQIELPFFTNDYQTQENAEVKDVKPVKLDTSLDEKQEFKNALEDSSTKEIDDRIEPSIDVISNTVLEEDSIDLGKVEPIMNTEQFIEAKPVNSSIDDTDKKVTEPPLESESNSQSESSKTIKPSTSKPYIFTKKPKKSNENDWFHAAKTGNLGGLNRMIIEGIDIDCVDNKGCTALIRASGHSRRAVVSFLLQQNANIEARSLNGSTALSSSIIGDCRRVAGLLLDNNADVNALGPSGYSYMTIAAAQWNESMLSILSRYGGDVYVLNDTNQTLLHIVSLAAEYYHNVNKAKNSIQFLLDKGLDINAKDKKGNSALMILCGCHKAKYEVDDRNIASIAHCLIKMGAAAAITNNAGNSALDSCKLHKLQQTKGVLMNALSWND